jgi:predicted PhzF superfamily epimerase YddE/YHI9
MPIELNVLRVFTAADGQHGNPLGVFVRGMAVPEARRQAVAADLGFSETVFVDDAADGRIRIFTPAAELAFAGHPTVGTGWLLDRLGQGVELLRCPAGDLPTWADDDGLRWVRARPEWVHPITIDELASARAVEDLAGPPPDERSYYAWAWEDEAEGHLRSRYFVPELGIGEDEATGAAAVVMGSRLGRSITIRQGRGSILHVRPGPDGSVEIGGRCLLDEVRAYR